jgi:hypothetical protein
LIARGINAPSRRQRHRASIFGKVVLLRLRGSHAINTAEETKWTIRHMLQRSSDSGPSDTVGCSPSFVFSSGNIALWREPERAVPLDIRPLATSPQDFCIRRNRHHFAYSFTNEKHYAICSKCRGRGNRSVPACRKCQRLVGPARLVHTCVLAQC